MAEPKSIFSLESTQQLRIDIDGTPHAVRSMKEFRLKEQAAFQRDCQKVGLDLQNLFDKKDEEGNPILATDEEIDAVTAEIDALIVKIVVEDPTPFLALSEFQKLDVVRAFSGNAPGGSDAPKKSSSQDSPASTELTRSA